MKLRNLFNKLRPSSAKAKVLSGLLAVGVVLTGTAAIAGWSPNRTVFDWNNPEQRKGSLTGPVFNSFVNTPYYGDERAFFDSARTDVASGSNAFKDVTQYPSQGSGEVILRSYIHNNANQDTNASGLGVAKNTRMRIDLPTGTASELRARSYINWDNPAPGYAGEVTDTTELVDSSAFSVEYVPGSAILYTSAHPASAGGYKLADSIVGSGVALGHDQINGDYPGCFEFQATVEIRVKIKKPQLSIVKQVRKAGVNAQYGKMTEVKPGDKIQWGLTVQNKGQQNLSEVAVSDQLPPHMALVPGSVRYIDTAQDVVQTDTPLFTTGGIGIGQLVPNQGFNIRFDTTAKDDFSTCEVTVRNLGYAKSKEVPEIVDYADVKITKDNCNEVTPEYSCDLLTGVKIGDFKFRFTTKYTAKDGATLKSLSYNFGDDSTAVNTTNTVVEHQYDKAGTYTTRVTATFTVNGQDKVVNSPACETQVTATDKPAEPVYSCDLLVAEKIGDRKFRFVVKFTARDGANLKFVNWNYGDGSTLMTDKTVTEHTFAKDGTFVTRAVLTFDVNGQDKLVDSDKCAAPVTLTSTPPTPPTTPGTPTTLPNTGTGNVFGIFAATSLVGAFLHRAYASRKASV